MTTNFRILLEDMERLLAKALRNIKKAETKITEDQGNQYTKSR